MSSQTFNNISLSEATCFRDVDWTTVPDRPGVYIINEGDEVIYVGMSGRNGKGNLRNRLKDHCSGQIVNMFAQYLFLARVQFIPDERITLPIPYRIFQSSRCCRRFERRENRPTSASFAYAH